VGINYGDRALFPEFYHGLNDLAFEEIIRLSANSLAIIITEEEMGTEV